MHSPGPTSPRSSKKLKLSGLYAKHAVETKAEAEPNLRAVSLSGGKSIRVNRTPLKASQGRPSISFKPRQSTSTLCWGPCCLRLDVQVLLSKVHLLFEKPTTLNAWGALRYLAHNSLKNPAPHGETCATHATPSQKKKKVRRTSDCLPTKFAEPWTAHNLPSAPSSLSSDSVKLHSLPRAMMSSWQKDAKGWRRTGDKMGQGPRRCCQHRCYKRPRQHKA